MLQSLGFRNKLSRYAARMPIVVDSIVDAPAVWMMVHREMVRAGYGYVAVSRSEALSLPA